MQNAVHAVLEHQRAVGVPETAERGFVEAIGVIPTDTAAQFFEAAPGFERVDDERFEKVRTVAGSNRHIGTVQVIVRDVRAAPRHGIGTDIRPEQGRRHVLVARRAAHDVERGVIVFLYRLVVDVHIGLLPIILPPCGTVRKNLFGIAGLRLFDRPFERGRGLRRDFRIAGIGGIVLAAVHVSDDAHGAVGGDGEIAVSHAVGAARTRPFAAFDGCRYRRGADPGELIGRRRGRGSRRVNGLSVFGHARILAVDRAAVQVRGSIVAHGKRLVGIVLEFRHDVVFTRLIEHRRRHVFLSAVLAFRRDLPLFDVLNKRRFIGLIDAAVFQRIGEDLHLGQERP